MGADIYICVYCGKEKHSYNGTGSDVACCGEVGHVEEQADGRDGMAGSSTSTGGAT